MCDKITYTTLREARTVLHAAKGRRNGKTKKVIPVREYFCEICNGYHLTKRKNNY